MRVFSATEAISPAISRTTQVLTKPFHWAQTWKITASAYVSVMGTAFFPFPLLGLLFLPVLWRTGPRWAVWAVLAGAVLLTALFWFIFMLCSRLQFAVFDVVLYRGQQIAEPWRRYAQPAARWSRFKMWIGMAITVVAGLPVALCVALIMKAHRTGGGIAAGMGLIFLGYCGLLLFMLAASLLNDFMMPILALEDATIGEAWRRTRDWIEREPGQVALYALLKIVLGFIAQMTLTLGFELVFGFVIVILALIGWVLGIVLHGIGVPENILSGLGITLMILLYPIFIFYVVPMAQGAATVFLESYKLYFLSGRYPLLGDLLSRSNLTSAHAPMPPVSFGGSQDRLPSAPEVFPDSSMPKE